ncbi:MAG TPA: permease-like cell division protein FtsX [Steroidobacteraceae bacterium]|nr:permease-like cell division protein FtsX [Steroidobacteraceae bacterium]
MSRGNALSVLLERHAQALLGSLGRLARQPFATVLTVLVIGIALALPAALHVAVANMRVVTAGLDETVQLSAYLAMATTPDEARRISEAIAARPGVDATTLVSPEEGLAEFRKLSGLGDALEALPDNPLPWLVQVRPMPSRADASGVEALAAEIRDIKGVDLVEADTAWVRRLHAIEDTMAQLVLLVAAVLAAGVLGVVGNTIRLEIDGRRAEIEVTKLVGGSDAFVRRPFLYSGLWQGLAGGLIAVGLVAAGLAALEPFVLRLATAYGSDFALRGLSIDEWPLVIAGSGVLGFLGAWLAANYHLRRIEPRA